MNRENSGLLLLGVGGGGCRFAAAARQAFGEELAAVAYDTDEAAARSVTGLRVQLLGATRLNKQGAGGVHANGRLAAQDDLPAVLAACKDARIVVAVACLGGGTGGGATPAILKALRAEGKVTLCFATLPFAFEGRDRQQNAERDRPILEQSTDTLVLTPLDDLYAGQETAPLPEAAARAEAVMAAGLSLLWRLLLTPGYIAFDAARLQNMLVNAGPARFGFAEASGEGRAEAAAAALARSPLLRRGEALAGGRALAVGMLAGPDLRLAEVGAAMDRLRSLGRPDCHVEMGVVLEPRCEGRLALVALAFENWTPAEARSGGAAADGDLLIGVAGKDGQKDAKLHRRSKFGDVEATVHRGENLDIPTYQRRHIRLDR